jgi:hypothetical protein
MSSKDLNNLGQSHTRRIIEGLDRQENDADEHIKVLDRAFSHNPEIVRKMREEDKRRPHH